MTAVEVGGGLAAEAQLRIYRATLLVAELRKYTEKCNEYDTLLSLKMGVVTNVQLVIHGRKETGNKSSQYVLPFDPSQYDAAIDHALDLRNKELQQMLVEIEKLKEEI